MNLSSHPFRSYFVGSAIVRQDNRTLDSNSLYTGICSKEVFLNLKESIVSERTSEEMGISAETAVTEKIDTPVGESNDDVDIDLSAQPTLIACKDDMEIHHRTMDEQCIFELVRSSKHVIPEGKTTDILDSDIEGKGEVSKKTEETTDLILSSIVDFNPKNKGKLTDKNRHSAEYISQAFKPYREQLRFENFKDLVSAEVMSFGINQSIFSKAVLKRSQGYLSDLLNRQEAIMSMEEPSRMFTNFMKIKSFLDLDEAERRVRYYECVKQSEAEQNQNDKYSLSKINRRKKRMSFSKGVKDSLKALFKDRMSMPDVDELTEISERFGLEMATVKNFFRNFKARSKISETL